MTTAAKRATQKPEDAERARFQSIRAARREVRALSGASGRAGANFAEFEHLPSHPDGNGKHLSRGPSRGVGAGRCVSALNRGPMRSRPSTPTFDVVKDGNAASRRQLRFARGLRIEPVPGDHGLGPSICWKVCRKPWAPNVPHPARLPLQCGPCGSRGNVLLRSASPRLAMGSNTSGNVWRPRPVKFRRGIRTREAGPQALDAYRPGRRLSALFVGLALGRNAQRARANHPIGG